MSESKGTSQENSWWRILAYAWISVIAIAMVNDPEGIISGLLDALK